MSTDGRAPLSDLAAPPPVADLYLRLSIAARVDSASGASDVTAPQVGIDFKVDRATIDRVAAAFRRLTQAAASDARGTTGPVEDPLRLVITVGAPNGSTTDLAAPLSADAASTAAAAIRAARDAQHAPTDDPLAQFPLEIIERAIGEMFAYVPPSGPAPQSPPAAPPGTARRKRTWRLPTFSRPPIYGDYQPFPLASRSFTRRSLGDRARAAAAATSVAAARVPGHGRVLRSNAAALGRDLLVDARHRWDMGAPTRAAVGRTVWHHRRQALAAAMVLAAAGVSVGFFANRALPAVPPSPTEVVLNAAPLPVAAAPSLHLTAVPAIKTPLRTVVRPRTPAAAAPVKAPRPAPPAVVAAPPSVAVTVGTTPLFVGSVLVESQPSGAQIFLNQRPMGVSPLLLSKMRVGSYALWVDLEGYSLWSRGIRVVSNQQTRVSATMERLPEPIRTLADHLRLGPRHSQR